jgi:phospholipid/cholesterol/gamma-HCH transport system ATP-binding protein
MAGVINNLIRQCVADLGATAVTITHDMTSVRHIADQVAMIYEGKFIWSGPIGALETSGNAYVDQFIHGRTEGPIALQVRSA